MTKKAKEPPKTEAEPLVAMTLKIEREMYDRLAAFAIATRGEKLKKSKQEIMKTALEEYLKRNKA